jgi:D-alanyl-D-alanine dipeptidase
MAKLLALLALLAPAALAQRTDLPPAPPTPSVAALIGHYGPEGDEAVVFERNGRAYVRYREATRRLEPVASDADTRAFAVRTTALGDTVTFTVANGRAMALYGSAGRMGRRPIGPAEGDVFRIDPVRPVAGILRESQSATPPAFVQSGGADDLVDLSTIPNVRLDVRYATDDNFMGAALYPFEAAYARRSAADALAAAAAELATYDLGLIVHDAYRPWSVTWAFWQATPREQKLYVANPADASRHNRGAAVDVSLYRLSTGERVELPSDYDEFTPRAHLDYAGGTSEQRWYRALLQRVMREHGFSSLQAEWWHFDLRGWRSYPPMNVSFEQLRSERAAR